MDNYFEFNNKSVYHYCSIDSLYNILNTKSLWLTSLASTNDSKELKIGRELIKNTLENLIESEKDSNLKEIFKLILNSSKDRKTSNYLKKNLNFYASSFVTFPII